jgi:hypothetical protein
MCAFNFLVKVAALISAFKLFVELGGAWSLKSGNANGGDEPWNVDNSSARAGGAGGADPASQYQAPQGAGGYPEAGQAI